MIADYFTLFKEKRIEYSVLLSANIQLKKPETVYRQANYTPTIFSGQKTTATAR